MCFWYMKVHLNEVNDDSGYTLNATKDKRVQGVKVTLES